MDVLFYLPYGNRKAVKKTVRWTVFRPWEIPFIEDTAAEPGWGKKPPPRKGTHRKVCAFFALRESKGRPDRREGNQASGGLFLGRGRFPLLRTWGQNPDGEKSPHPAKAHTERRVSFFALRESKGRFSYLPEDLHRRRYRSFFRTVPRSETFPGPEACRGQGGNPQ